jgi:hypothetical protein
VDDRASDIWILPDVGHFSDDSELVVSLLSIQRASPKGYEKKEEGSTEDESLNSVFCHCNCLLYRIIKKAFYPVN